MESTNQYAIDTSRTRSGTFRENKVITMAADALDPYIARSSAAMVLVVWDKPVFIFYQKDANALLAARNERKWK